MKSSTQETDTELNFGGNFYSQSEKFMSGPNPVRGKHGDKVEGVKLPLGRLQWKMLASCPQET